jgi:hypothetical protein
VPSNIVTLPATLFVCFSPDGVKYYPSIANTTFTVIPDAPVCARSSAHTYVRVYEDVVEIRTRDASFFKKASMAVE